MGQDCVVGSLVMEGRVLDAALVERLNGGIRALGTSSPRIVVDCSRVEALTPQGLSALIELGARTAGIVQVALAAPGKALLRGAVEVGLAERFAIYASVEAATRALSTTGD